MSKCITLSYGKVVGKAKNYPYHQPALYKEYVTKDGRKVWKYVNHLGTARRSVRLAEEDALDIAKNEGYNFISGVRQWTPIEEE